MPSVVDRGDIIWLEMRPTHGREQAGHRPHLVLSERRFHDLRGMAIVVPMTTSRRDWPTRIAIGAGLYAICEQPRSVSFQRVTRVENTRHDVSQVRRIINYLMGGDFT
ncbi:MAG: type II toxin-antitoxin system PemK/MazF family toxin [Propioniciclava sp.]|uniref:type II toxin-antitoxin system PemK/MazF family toxin n=1 Tax=Propioniciclava sp. TaxID=2038686 RepID=UPI0039E243C0